MIRWNYHTHTTLCDGKSTPEEMVGEAISQGLEILGFSGHMDCDIHMNLEAYHAQITYLQQKYYGKIEILRGVELDNLTDPSCTKGMDYWIGSTHYLDLPGEEDHAVDQNPQVLENMCRRYFHGDYYRMCRAYFDLESAVVQRTGCTFIGHFDLITRFNDAMHAFDETDRRYLDPARDALKALRASDVPLEINCGAYSRGLKRDLYPAEKLLRYWHELDGQIVISSDAHHRQFLTGGFDTAVQKALACGFRQTWYLSRDAFGQVQWKHYAFDLTASDPL